MSGQDYEQLMLFPADSPASHFPWLESKREKKMIVTSGRRCSELSESCARIALSVKTYLESSALPPGGWSRIWSVQAIASSCLILKLRLSERGTGGLGCSSSESQMWPTPTATDGKRACRGKVEMLMNGETTFVSRRGNRGGLSNLRERVLCKEKGLWPTPRANEYKDTLQSVPPSRMKDPGKCNLTQAVAMKKLFTTTCEADAQGSHGGNNCRSLRTDVAGQLNPAWVEWLMGFPIGWADLSASEMR